MGSTPPRPGSPPQDPPQPCFTAEQIQVIGEAMQIARYDLTGTHADQFWAHIHSARKQ